MASTPGPEAPGRDLAFLARLAAAPASETRRLLTTYICALTVEFLGWERSEVVGPQDHFLELGFDSLMAVDFKLLLEARLGCELSATALFDCPTPVALVDYLAEVLRQAATPHSPHSPHSPRGPSPPRHAEPTAQELQALGPDELRALLARQSGRLRALEEAMKEPIAVVGVGGRFPGADDPEAFWRLQVEGRDAITEVPASRWDIERYFSADKSAPGKMYSRWGGFVNHLEGFDARFFGISPREARELDPNQRLLLEVAWETLEHAGIAPEALAGSATGVFIGSRPAEYYIGQSDYRPEDCQTYFATGNALSTMAGRVSYVLGLNGPCIALDTACSSSLVAVHYAVQSLRRGECSAALAGGLNTLLDPVGTISVCKASMLSDDGRCKTFDASANGYVRSEGCGLLLLKRLSRSLADGDRILALIRGTAVNQDGASGGLTVPNGAAQEAVIRQALASGGCRPDEIDYLEAHGTGTSLGDPIEVAALDAVFGPGRTRPLLVGSVKTNIGHLETGAGIAGLIKVILALQHELLPPLLHLRRKNPHIPWERTIVRPTEVATPWPAGDRRRLAGVSSFGFSGTNAHTVVEEAPPPPPRPAAAPRPVAVLPLSAGSESALEALCGRYAAQLQAGADGAPGPSLADVCGTAARGRSHLGVRRAFVASSLSDLGQQLAAACAGKPAGPAGRAPAHPPKLGFLFTGQGSQYAGMARALDAAEPVFHDALQRSSARLAPLLGMSLPELLWGPGSARLDDTEYTQPALFAVQMALVELLGHWGIAPTWVAGHSVGEYAAACTAGVFSLEDGCRLIAARGRLMAEHCARGAMLAVRAPVEAVRPLVDARRHELALAAINGRDSVVLAGSTAAVEAAQAALARQGLAATRLAVSHAFHSPLMDAVLPHFEAVARDIAFARPRSGFVSCLDPGPADSSVAAAGYWVRHVRDPVRFADGMRALDQEACDILLEIGPSPTLLGMARRLVERKGVAWLPTLRPGVDDVLGMQTTLAELYVRGVPIDWQGVHRDFAWRRTALPTYPFQRERFWLEGRPSQAASGQDGRTGSVAAGSEASGAGAGHPFLGARLETAVLPAGELLFASSVSEHAPALLGEHRAYGQALMPAAAFVDWALAAGVSCLGSAHLQISELAIASGLSLDGQPRPLQAHLLPTADGALRFRLLSRSAGREGGAWSEHVSGTLGVLEPESGGPVFEVGELFQRCPRDADVEALYASYAEQGLHYGPAFRALSTVQLGTDELLAGIELPAGVAELPQGVVHPVLLDACLQTTRVLSMQRGYTSLYLPTGVRRLAVHGSRARVALCRTQLRSTSAEQGDPRLLVMDFELMDGDGRLVVRAEGLQLLRASPEALLASTDPLRTLGHVVGWVRRQAEPASSRRPGRWLLIDAGGALGEPLAASLQAAGASTRLLAGAELAALAGEAAAGGLDGAPNRLLRLLDEPGDDLQGIVHLAASDGAVATAPTPGAGPPPGDAAATIRARGSGTATEARLQALCSPLLALLRALAARRSGGAGPPAPRLWLLTRGAVAADGPGEALDVPQAALSGLAAVIELEHPELRCTHLDLDPIGEADESAVLARELLADGAESRLARRWGERRAARLQRRPPPGRPAPRSAAWRLRARSYGQLEQLDVLPAARRPPQGDEVEVEVAAAALNFKDVLFVLGMLQPFTGIAHAPDQPLGLECSGVVTRVGPAVKDLEPGDLVLASAPGSLASHVLVPRHALTRRPAGLDHFRAAALPTVYLTALHALQGCARLQRGESVLVHAAAGGVGQAAIAVARRRGARVLATASPGKWAWLRRQGIEPVGSSRDGSFVAGVQAATGGRGVDVVLDSLGGEVVAQSLSLLAPGGRFVELGKLGVWTAEQVHAARPDVGYTLLDMAELVLEQPQLQRALLEELRAGLEDGSLPCLPTRVVPLSETVTALQRLAQARSVGKLVVAMPRPATASGERSWLITGGLGALGLTLARGLVASGARQLLLVGRGAPGQQARAAIARLESSGARVRTAAVDVSDRAALAELLATVDPPLVGVVHAAGVLDDGLLVNQDWPRFRTVLAPKWLGALHLHELTRGLPLEHFVCFSSMAGLLGNAGQGNYAAANALLDALCQQRVALGLPGASLAFGPWSGGGMATRASALDAGRLAAAGIGSLLPEQGLAFVLAALAEPVAGLLGGFSLDWPRFLQRYRHGQPGFFEAVARLGDGQGAGRAGGARAGQGSADDDALLAGLAEAGLDAARERLLGFVGGQLASVLGFASAADIDPQKPFLDMGVDSLLAVDLRNRLESRLSLSLPATLVFDHPDLAALAEHLALLVTAGGEPSEEDLAAVERLSDAEAAQLLANDAGDGPRVPTT